MKCLRAKKMMSRYMDDALRPDEKEVFDSHIRRCTSCRDVLEEMRTVHRLFASARRYPAPYGFTGRVLANVEEKEGLRHRNFFPIKVLFLRAAQVALALVVVTTGIISGNLFLAESADPMGHKTMRETFSLHLFQAAPPDSMGGIYTSFMRPGHEK